MKWFIAGVKETTVSGIVLMAMYMTMDSFTSNWQSKLFSSYNMSSVQMMCGVNLFSCLFTAVSLLSQGTLFKSFVFMTKVRTIWLFVTTYSSRMDLWISFDPFFVLVSIICHGLLFPIYLLCQWPTVHFLYNFQLWTGRICDHYNSQTSKSFQWKFSAAWNLKLKFLTLIRFFFKLQVFAILLSCLIYHHNLSSFASFGVTVVFFAIFLRIYCNQRLRNLRKQQLRGSVQSWVCTLLKNTYNLLDIPCPFAIS